MSDPDVASSSAALSRTVRVTAWPTEAPPHPSPASGPMGLRARVQYEREFTPKRNYEMLMGIYQAAMARRAGAPVAVAAAAAEKAAVQGAR